MRSKTLKDRLVGAVCTLAVLGVLGAASWVGLNALWFSGFLRSYVTSGSGTAADPWEVDEARLNADFANNTVRTIWISEGHYNIDNQIAMVSTTSGQYGIVMRGIGNWSRTVLHWTGTAGVYVLRVGSLNKEASLNVTRFYLEDFSINGGESATALGGMDLRGSFLVHVNRVSVAHFAHPTSVLVNATNTFNFAMTYSHLWGQTTTLQENSVGLALGCADLNGPASAWAQTEVLIEGNLIQQTGIGVLISNNGNAAGAGNIENLHLTDNGFGGHSHYGVKVEDTGAAAIMGIGIDHNHFERIGIPASGTELRADSWGIWAENVQGLTIEQNQFHDMPHSIYVKDAKGSIGFCQHFGEAAYTFPAGSYAVKLEEVTANALKVDLSRQNIYFGVYDNDIIRTNNTGSTVTRGFNLTAGDWSAVVSSNPGTFQGVPFNRIGQNPAVALNVSPDGVNWWRPLLYSASAGPPFWRPVDFMDEATFSAWVAAKATTTVTAAVQAAADAASTGPGELRINDTYLTGSIHLYNDGVNGYASDPGKIRITGGGTTNRNAATRAGGELLHIDGETAPLIKIRGTWSPFKPAGGVVIDGIRLEGGTQTCWLIEADMVNDGPALTVKDSVLVQLDNPAGGGVKAYSSYNWQFSNTRFLGPQTDSTGDTAATGIALYITTFGTITVTGVDTGTDVLTLGTAQPFRENDPFTVASTGTLPAPLQAGVVYYVRESTATGFKVAATYGGAAIDLTSAGSGTITAVHEGGVGVTSNQMVFSQCDFYRWGSAVLIGSPIKSAQTTIGTIDFIGGQASHSDYDLVQLMRNARTISFQAFNFEHWGGAATGSKAGDGLVASNGAKNITLQGCNFNGVASEAADEWAVSIGYDGQWGDGYEFAWNVVLDNIEFQECRNGIRINTNATAAASIDGIEIDHLEFHPNADATGTGIEIKSGSTKGTGIEIGPHIRYQGFSDTNAFAANLSDPSGIALVRHDQPWYVQRGTAVCLNGTSSIGVTLPIAMDDSNYRIWLQQGANISSWYSSKTSSGFTVNCDSETHTAGIQTVTADTPVFWTVVDEDVKSGN